MKNLEKNKIFASVVVVLLIVSVSSNLIDVLYKPIKVVDSMFKQEDIDNSTNINKNINSKDINVVALLANASAEAGKKVFSKCISCHNVAKGSPNKIGPSLWNIVGRKKASIDNFTYSKAMFEKGGVWDYESLFHYLYKPQAYIKGTRMSFAGIKDDKQIADLIMYLRSYSDSSIALPI